MTYQRVKGMEDYYPEVELTRQAIYRILREQARKYGFLPVDTPAIETMSLLTAKSGEEIKEQLFTLAIKSNEELALRFDLTVPLTRLFAAKQKELQKPVKWFALDKMWRYEAPQKGRQREFYQLSVELFGSANPEADATIINLLVSCFQRFGLTSEDIALKINNRKLLEGLLLEVTSQDKLPAVVRIIDKSAKISDVQFVEELLNLGIDRQKIEVIKKIVRCKGDASIIESIKTELEPNGLAAEGIAELESVLKLVDPSFIVVDLSIARGLAYYTGNVFECFDRSGKYRSLAGGGRYDNLVELFGGDETPATGFAIGLETLYLVLSDLERLPDVKPSPEYFVAPVTEKVLPEALKIAQKLRERTSVDIDLMRRKLGKQFEYADSIGAAKVVIVGEKDLTENQVTVRDMKTGTEEKVGLDEL